MKFIKTPNDAYVVAKRVSIELEKHAFIHIRGVKQHAGVVGFSNGSLVYVSARR